MSNFNGQSRATGRRGGVLAGAVAAVVLGVAGPGVVRSASAATDIWTGANTADPGTYPANTAVWDNATANWSNGGSGVYTGPDTVFGTLGDDVVFTDNFTGNTNVAVSSTSQTPASMTFSHIAGSTPTNYTFLVASTSNTPPDPYSSTSPFGATTTPGPVLTLDTGFLGHVTLKARANSGSNNGSVVVRSGTLEIDDAGALPGGSSGRNNPQIELAGGTLEINIQGSNTQPASSQLHTTMNVTADSTLMGSPDHFQDHFYNGAIAVDAGATLHVDTQMGFVVNGFAGSSGTIDLGSSTNVLRFTTGSATAGFNLGTATATMESNNGGSATVVLGSLSGGSGTFLRGSHQGGTAPTAYTIGSAGSSTFDGTIADGTGSAAAIASVNKVGATTLTLTGANTYTGGTNVIAGTLLVDNTSGSGTGTGAVNVTGGVLGGSGTISGLVTIAAGGALAPGNSPGSITLTGGLSLPDGAALNVDLGTGGSDEVVVSGGTLTGAATPGSIVVNAIDSGGLAPGQVYTLINFSGATLSDFDASDFTLANPNVSGSFAIVGNTLQVTTAAVPEPGSVALVLLGAGAVMGGRRRRRGV